MQETQVQSQEDPQEKEVTTHSSILAWRVPWTKEPGSVFSAVTWKGPRSFRQKLICVGEAFLSTCSKSLSNYSNLIPPGSEG